MANVAGGNKVVYSENHIFYRSTALVGLGILIVEVFNSHTRHNTLGTTPVDL
jgi:hypothetical protein